MDDPYRASWALAALFTTGALTAPDCGTNVLALADVSTVLVEGEDGEGHLELQVGRERVLVADGLGYEVAR